MRSLRRSVNSPQHSVRISLIPPIGNASLLKSTHTGLNSKSGKTHPKLPEVSRGDALDPLTQ